MESSSGRQGNKPQQSNRGGASSGIPANEIGTGASSSSSGAINSNNPNHPQNAQYMQQIMMSSPTDPSLLSQHPHHHHHLRNPGANRGDPLLYQNSLLDVASMMNPAMQILPPSSTSSASVGGAPSVGAAAISPVSASQSRATAAATSNNLALHTAASAATLLPPSAPSNSYTHAHLSSPPSSSTQSKSKLTQSKNISSAIPAVATSTTLGGVRIPPVPPNASTAQQVQIAAAAAAAEAAPPKGYHGPIPGGVRKRDSSQMLDGSINNSTNNGMTIGIGVGGEMMLNSKNQSSPSTAAKRGKRSTTNQELTEEEKKQLNRDRNRQHARSTRLRKKAYVNKLKELVDGLHAERSEEARKRRVAVQHLAEIQGTRRKVISKFLQFHAGYEDDRRKWETILEDGFYLKQPLTPFRSFRTLEIEQSMEKDCRISLGIDSAICDAASMSVMIESVGFRSCRWRHIKRDEFLCRYEGRADKSRQQMPGSIVRQNNRMQHAISSLSSSSGSSNGNGSGSDEERKRQKEMLLNRLTTSSTGQNQNHGTAKKVSSSSSGGSSSLSNQAQSNNDFHDYHAQPLPDPRLDGGSTDSDSPTNASDNAVVGKHVCTDSSSSGEDEKLSKKRGSPKRNVPPNVEIHSKLGSMKPNTKIESISAAQEDSMKRVKGAAAVTDPSVSSNSEACTTSVKSVATKSSLPPNIARTGGIAHNIRPIVSDLNSRLSTAPAIALPPFTGIGKRVVPMRNPVIPAVPNRPIQPTASIPQVGNYIQPKKATTNAPSTIISKGNVKNEPAVNGVSSSLQQSVIIDPDNGTTSSDDSSIAQILAHYHINEDDMLLTDDVLMCPFIFRTQDAVLCGALAECVMPGMLRAEFSDRNKIVQLEMVYDAMGFMQQLERASGSEGKPHIIPNSLETLFQPSTDEARVITTAKPPYLIVSVNELWTRTTKYTQMEAEEKRTFNIIWKTD